MEEPGWIQMFLLLTMLLQLPGVVSGDLFYTIRAGDDVALSCENVIKDHRNCDTTTWGYGKPGRTTQELVTLGQVTYSRSDSLSLAGNCSLVLRNISAEDAGSYFCSQYDAGLYFCRQYEIEGGSTSRRDAPVYLSVVTLREQTEQNKVTFTCSVSPYDECRHEVKWLFKGNDVEKDHPDVNTSSPSSCSAAVTFQTSNYVYSSRFKLFICEVETENKQQLFTFSSGPTGEKPQQPGFRDLEVKCFTDDEKQLMIYFSPPTTTSMVTSGGKTDTTESAGGSPPTPGPSCTAVWLRFLIGSVGLAALTAGVVVTSRRTRAKGEMFSSKHERLLRGEELHQHSRILFVF
nr:uncharacterized protein LOC107377869 isoform X1 [Nothobranchius furzeri]